MIKLFLVTAFLMLPLSVFSAAIQDGNFDETYASHLSNNRRMPIIDGFESKKLDKYGLSFLER